MWVTTDRGHAWYSEVEGSRQLVSELLCEWVHVASEAAVRVAADAEALCQGCDLLHWVVVAECVLGTGGNQADGVGVNGSFHGFQVGFETLGDWDLPDLHAEVESSLVEGAVSGLRANKVGFSNASFCSTLLSVGQQAQQNAFGASGSDDSASVLVSVVQIKGPSNNLSLTLGYIHELVDVQGVGHDAVLHYISDKLPVSFLSGVHRTRGMPSVGVVLAALGVQLCHSFD